MNKRFCDVCDKEINPEFIVDRFRFYEGGDVMELHTIDLCYEHAKMVYDFINSLSEKVKEGK